MVAVSRAHDIRSRGKATVVFFFLFLCFPCSLIQIGSFLWRLFFILRERQQWAQRAGEMFLPTSALRWGHLLPLHSYPPTGLTFPFGSSSSFLLSVFRLIACSTFLRIHFLPCLGYRLSFAFLFFLSPSFFARFLCAVVVFCLFVAIISQVSSARQKECLCFFHRGRGRKFPDFQI